MRKPIELVVDRLTGMVRLDPSGAKSLAHLLVIVPTAQSGRRLRQKLAERLGALIPPTIMQPSGLLADSDASLATRADMLVAFAEALGAEGSLEIAAGYVNLRDSLGAGALDFADVAERVPGILKGEFADAEIERWQNLAKLEERYLEALTRRGLTDRVVSMKRMLSQPSRPGGVEEVVVAYVFDPLPAMRKALEALALPVTEIAPADDDGRLLDLDQIVPSGTAESESTKIANIFAGVGKNEALPALCVADPELFPEIQGALQSVGFKVHDPSNAKLATSSLGHLATQIAAMMSTSSYDVLSAFIRGGDVRRWLVSELGLSETELAESLAELDRRQAQYLPERIEDIAPHTGGKLRAMLEFVQAQFRRKGIRGLLQAIFSGRTLDTSDPDARESAAAATVMNSLIDECFGEKVPEAMRWELFARRLEEATYSLEPDEGDVVFTDGWLELPYLDADELVIAGFSEKCVPESVVGHAFLPDSLRHGLGLPDNEMRTKRDIAILKTALGCRASGAVKVFFHSQDANGDVLKPSRLLFLTDDNQDLVRRVKTLYSVRAGTETSPTADLPEGWKLQLEIPPAYVELKHASPSRIDEYQKCPFTYYLKRTFGEREDDRAEELDPAEFGNLAHQALERWGCGALKDSEDVEAIANELADAVDALLGERFGTGIPAIVALQGESLKRRLRDFATIQVEWHRQGWRIVATEHRFEVTLGHTRIYGRCDRIDFNAEKGEWCVIDYKTWDSPDKAEGSLQLPLYCSMLDADLGFAEAKRDRIISVYCLIGKNRETTLYGEPANGATVPEAETRVKELIGRIERGIFWPPSPTREWQWDFKDWIRGAPEDCVAKRWVDDQIHRAEGLSPS